MRFELELVAWIALLMFARFEDVVIELEVVVWFKLEVLAWLSLRFLRCVRSCD